MAGVETVVNKLQSVYSKAKHLSSKAAESNVTEVDPELLKKAKALLDKVKS